jgi:hypothetical protein
MRLIIAGINDCEISRPDEYLSYEFTNMSEEIVRLFTEACDLVGISDYRHLRRSRHLRQQPRHLAPQDQLPEERGVAA